MSATNAMRVSGGVFQELGVVTSVDDAELLLVETESGFFEARRAASCLLTPEVGDRVLVAVPRNGPLYVLAVLERGSDASLRLSLDGDAEVSCTGQLGLFSPEGIELRSGGEVATKARTASTTALDTQVHTERLSLVARFVEANTKQVKGVLGMVDTVLDRLSQKVRTSYRYVEGLDMTRAGDVDLRAKSSVSVRGKNAFLSADELVKMHGEQIHLG